ncbi:MAG TPA: hypothetical protein VHX18_13520 [Rhizomicrobium sp.]|jgi:hypothetical protein|nr:hypothetical protein [Rhizomicrobium sp.]
MDFWQRLTVEWPCRLGDWLWANIAVPLSTLPRQMTLRRAIFLAALLVAAIALAQLFTVDVAFYMAGDIAFYCEIASAVMFIVVRGHIRGFAHVAIAMLKQATRRAAVWYRKSVGARRQRGAKKPALGDTGSDDDGIADWLAGFAAHPVPAH